jgi:hypothetical protein
MIPNPIGYKLSLAEMKDEIPIDNRTFILLGGVTINDIVAGIFRYDVTSTATPDDIDVVKPTDILLANPGRYIRQKLGGAVIARGVFYNNADIAFVVGTPLSIPLNVNQSISQFISHNTVTNNSRIIANKDGVMELSISPQVLKGGAGSGSIYFWLKKNGVTVANSGFKISASNNDTRLPFFTMSSTVSATDYLEVAAQATSANFSLDYTSAPLAGVPNIPSIIITAILYNNFPN